MSIIDKGFVKDYITNNQHKVHKPNGEETIVHTPVQFRWTHGATDYHLGDGLIVYSLIQFMRAKTCVCLGSGGGFIPRLMTQARFDLHDQEIFEGTKEFNWGDIGATYVVDATNGVGGTPDWVEESSFFRTHFSPRFINNTTEKAFYDFFVKQDIKIDYLHIDADHSYEGVKLDFELYSKILSPNGIISIHDTDKNYEKNLIISEDSKKYHDSWNGPIRFIEDIGPNWKVFNLFNEGTLPSKPSSTGITLLQRA